MGKGATGRHFSTATTKHNHFILWVAFFPKEWQGTSPIVTVPMSNAACGDSWTVPPPPPPPPPYLVYREDTSKNHPGGIKGRNIKPKVVYHHANPANTQRCFLRLFRKYQSLCPADAPADAFYLHPARNPTEHCWFSCRPLGNHPLSQTVGRMCKAAGIEGYRTNHSLRATSSSRLYQAGVEEKLVMERSGHRSVEGVRSYKRTSDDQRRALSDILNRAPKTARTTDPLPAPPTTTPLPLPPRSITTERSPQPPTQASLLNSWPSDQFISCTFNFNK